VALEEGASSCSMMDGRCVCGTALGEASSWNASVAASTTSIDVGRLRARSASLDGDEEIV